MNLTQTVIAMRALFAFLSVLWLFQAQAQFLTPGNFQSAPEGYCISVDTIAIHEGGELDGMTTYRFYLECLNPMDYLSSCSGDATNPLILESSSGSWYNSSNASGWNAWGINPAWFTTYSELEFDSYLTIGGENALVYASSAEPSTTWGAIDPTTQFEGGDPGVNVTVDDLTGGGWFVPFPGIEEFDSGHPAFAGEDLRIMLMQITTAGTFSGQVQLQVFMNGDQGQEWRDLLVFGGCPIPGCTDPTACNFNASASEDDGSCCTLMNAAFAMDPARSTNAAAPTFQLATVTAMAISLTNAASVAVTALHALAVRMLRRATTT